MELNRAIAVGEVDGPGAALVAIDKNASELDGYHLMHAARGAMLRRLGRFDEAGSSLARAAELAATEPERRFLARQIDELAAEARRADRA